MKTLPFVFVAFLSMLPLGAAQAVEPVRIGVLTDMSGGFAEVEGAGAVTAVRMAVADATDETDLDVQVQAADTEGDPDTAVNKAEAFLDDGADMLIGLAGTGVAEAVQETVGERAVTIATGAVADDLTNARCRATAFHWTPNLYVLTQATRPDLAEPEGTRNIFIYGADRYQALRTTYEDRVMAGGQDVAGQVFVTDIRRVGQYVTSGMLLFTPFYWNADAASREWSERFSARRATPPTYVQAATYSATQHYLRALAAAGTAALGTVADTMRDMEIDDMYARNATLRPDGHLQQDMLFMRVRAAPEMAEAWDYLERLERLSGEEIYQPMADSRCPRLQ